MDFLSANWPWLLVGLAVVWMLPSHGVGRGSGPPRSADARVSTGEGDSRHDHGSPSENWNVPRGRVSPRTSADIAAAEHSSV
jgi:hypothetical protein